jgi:hypothetical protein
MTNLSPAAQAVMDAVMGQDGEPYPLVIAAALRAAADQVVPPSLETEFYDRNPSLTLQKTVEIRQRLLAIAAELEGCNG